MLIKNIFRRKGKKAEVPGLISEILLPGDMARLLSDIAKVGPELDGVIVISISKDNNLEVRIVGIDSDAEVIGLIEQAKQVILNE